ncbi:stage II sporulation protein M [Methanoregula sp.]|uniref:stage II sporulation protein M n=1 Tax=Methanoregula sp. TaxID=2052170 RepID=UPI000CC37866|nr:stage II sporulation protein M [Methanoregula sp.]PKG32961.1 MAG: stage II sporulation protein M [Methanoregula sp.]
MSNSPMTNALIITLLLFFSTMCVGWIGSAQNPAIGEQLMDLFAKEVAGEITKDNPVDMCAKLFGNNLGACILLFLGGASFGILTIFIMSLNGIVIGAIMEIVHETHSPLFVAAALIPHGIFEIPAFIIAGALGILLAQGLIAEWYGEGDTGKEAARYGRLFVLSVLPLIAIAACVEAFITPVIIQLVA